MREKERNGGKSWPWSTEDLWHSSHSQGCTTPDGQAEAQNQKYTITGTTESVLADLSEKRWPLCHPDSGSIT